MQKEKNYHIEMIKLKNSEEISRMKREYELKIEDLQRESRSREALSREIAEKNGSLESKSGELRGVLDGLEMEMRRFRDKNSSLSEQLTIEEFANKKLEMLAEELERQKNDMENEIHLILDIELEKSNDLSLLEDRLANSETSEKNLTQKLAQLTDNFLNLEGHISSMKDRLSKADLRGEELGKKIRSVEELIRSKEMLIAEQKDRLLSLREEIEAHKDRENQSLL
jgi:chromosome segregation ATPase